MNSEQLNDIAFNFIESRIALTYGSIRKYLITHGGTDQDMDYFLVFVKHWLDNRNGLKWSDIILESSYDNPKVR